MTTEQAVQTGPCDETRCETCGEPESHAYHGDTQEVGHPFQPHLCDVTCSARFYREVFGCDVRFHAHWICYRHEHHGVPQPSNDRHFITDIMGDPSSAEAWLAMRDVLAEIERRDWTAIIETASTPGDFNVILLGGDDGPNCPPLATVHNEPAPRAVALAAWAASSSSEALAEGEGENEGIALMLGLEPCDGWVVTNFGSAGGAMLQNNCAHDRCYSTRTVGNMNGTIGGVPDYLGSTEHLGEGIARVFERGWGYSVVADEEWTAVTIYEPDTNVWREVGPTLQAAFWGALKRAEEGQ